MISSFSFVSCIKNENLKPNPRHKSPYSGTYDNIPEDEGLIGKFGNTIFKMENCSYSINEGLALSTITAYSDDGNQHITFTINEAIKRKKVYQVVNGNLSMIYDADALNFSSKEDIYIAYTGTLTITTIGDKKVSGTFSFAGSNFQKSKSTSIKNGLFSAKKN